MAGRRPKPTKLKIIQGNPGKRPLNPREPAPATDIPTRPGWLLPEAKREWSRIVPELHRLGLLTKVDRAALASYCQCWARLVEAQAVLDREGLTFETSTGYIQQRPEVAMTHKLMALLKSFLIEFGLTPASRSRLRVESEKEADPFAEFLARSGQKASSE